MKTKVMKDKIVIELTNEDKEQLFNEIDEVDDGSNYLILNNQQHFKLLSKLWDIVTPAEDN